jgi:hypothetical protein
LHRPAAAAGEQIPGARRGAGWGFKAGLFNFKNKTKMVLSAQTSVK